VTRRHASFGAALAATAIAGVLFCLQSGLAVRGGDPLTPNVIETWYSPSQIVMLVLAGAIILRTRLALDYPRLAITVILTGSVMVLAQWGLRFLTYWLSLFLSLPFAAAFNSRPMLWEGPAVSNDWGRGAPLYVWLALVFVVVVIPVAGSILAVMAVGVREVLWRRPLLR